MDISRGDVFIYINKGSLPSGYNNLECRVLGAIDRNTFIVYFEEKEESAVVDREELELFKRKKEVRKYSENDPYGEEYYGETDDYDLVKREEVFKKNKILKFYDFLTNSRKIKTSFNRRVNKRVKTDHLTESYDVKLTLSDVEEIIDYIEDYARKNEYEIYNMPKLDVSRMIPDIAYRTKEHDKIDPYSEDDWAEGNKIKLDSGGLRLFDKNEQSVLGIHYIIGSNGKCVVDFHIGYSEFKNVDLDTIKYILEKRL